MTTLRGIRFAVTRGGNSFALDGPGGREPKGPFVTVDSGMSLSDVRLRHATDADVPRLTDLVRSAYGHYVERLGEPPRPMTDDYGAVVRSFRVIVAERGGEVVGLVVLGVDDEGFFVDNVAVDPSHQRRGAGRKLLEHAETVARREGFDSIYLYTHELMTENLALYSRAGYVEYDRRLHGDACLVYMRKWLG